MSIHGRYDNGSNEQHVVLDSTVLDTDTSNATDSANDLWRAFAASAGNAALRVVLTIAFALLVIIVMGQVSGSPAEAAGVASEVAAPVAASAKVNEAGEVASGVATPAAAPAKADEAAALASLPITPIALRDPPAQAADLASLRRGATMFATYCLGCHAASRVRFGQLRELGFSNAEIAASLNPSSAPLTDAMHAAMPRDAAEKAFGRAPPDLSLAVREHGIAWMYTYLRSFYMDPAARMGANNLLVPGVAMPNVLAGLQGARNAVFVRDTQSAPDTAQQTRKFVKFEPLAPGSLTDAEYDRAIAELVGYMAWMADPHSVERHRLGPWVIGFLVLFSFSAWRLVRAYWREKR